MDDKTVNVADKVTEVNVKLSNILTALVLMVMSWVGVNIAQTKDLISNALTEIAVIKIENVHQEGAITEVKKELKELRTMIVNQHKYPRQALNE